MKHNLRAAQSRRNRLVIPDIATLELDLAAYFREILFVSSQQVVDHPHLGIAMCQQRAHQRRSDESGAACHYIARHAESFSISFSTNRRDSSAIFSAPGVKSKASIDIQCAYSRSRRTRNTGLKS